MRAIVIVLDSVGAGALPDAAVYGDSGANTLTHIQAAVPSTRLPNMNRLGLCRIEGLSALDPDRTAPPPVGTYGRLAERSAGKDTTTGHWELAGIVLDAPFPTFPGGFPGDFINRFSQAIGRKAIGNYPASGTAIIDELGERHMATGDVIVYTSADSVFQIAAHEDIIPIQEQYRINEAARKLLTGDLAVGRVIARPFIGVPGAFARTANRRDFSLQPTGETMLDRVYASGQAVTAVGKIEDIFAGRGISEAIHGKSNSENIDITLDCMQRVDNGLIFTNLVDFDMLYGHRRDAQGYANELMAFDARVPAILSAMRPDDTLIVTADHGCDPTHPGTDHTREYVPFLAVGRGAPSGAGLGTKDSFAYVSETVIQLLNA